MNSIKFIGPFFFIYKPRPYDCTPVGIRRPPLCWGNFQLDRESTPEVCPSPNGEMAPPLRAVRADCIALAVPPRSCLRLKEYTGVFSVAYGAGIIYTVIVQIMCDSNVFQSYVK